MTAWRFVVPPAPTPVEPGPAPTFSVVVAAYQAAATVAEAVDSALGQTSPPLEVVVCDDGSTDGTAEVLRRYGDAITVVRQENGGEGAAKNRAVRHARGDYVVVLDADDVFLPRRLEALAALAAQRPDLDILTTDAVVEADGVPVRHAYHGGWRFPAADQRAAILDRNFVLGLCAVRRTRWTEVGGFDPGLAYAADWELWQRMIFSGSRVGLVDEPLARYRLAGGTLSSNRTRLVRARLEVLSRAERWDGLTPQERRVLAAAVRRERLDLAQRRAAESLGTGGRAARARHAALLLGRGPGLRTRAAALLAVVSPQLAARRRARRSDGTVEIGAGLRVPGPPG